MYVSCLFTSGTGCGEEVQLTTEVKVSLVPRKDVTTSQKTWSVNDLSFCWLLPQTSHTETSVCQVGQAPCHFIVTTVSSRSLVLHRNQALVTQTIAVTLTDLKHTVCSRHTEFLRGRCRSCDQCCHAGFSFLKVSCGITLQVFERWIGEMQSIQSQVIQRI